MLEHRDLSERIIGLAIDVPRAEAGGDGWNQRPAIGPLMNVHVLRLKDGLKRFAGS